MYKVIVKKIMALKSINEIFGNNWLFRIPDYQRGYAWRDEEVVAFWNDLMNLPEGKSHFTGTLTLQAFKDAEKDKLGIDKWIVSRGGQPWFVIDGQQRLTTIIILLQCICEFLKNLPNNELFFADQRIAKATENIQEKFIVRENGKALVKTYLLGYIKNDVSERFLKRQIFNDEKTTCNEESYYTLNMKNAKRIFAENIKKIYEEAGDDLEEVERLYLRLTQNMMFDLIEVKQNDDFNIFVAFETINNRGRQLSNLEKLKNRLIYLTTLYPRDALDANLELPTRSAINEGWSHIYQQLGRNTKKSAKGKVMVLDDDEFLKTHWILYYQYSRKTGSDYINYLLNTKFTVQNVLQNLAQTESAQEMMHDDYEADYPNEATNEETNTEAKEAGLTLAEIDAYVTDLKEMAEPWYYTYFPQDAKDKLCDEEKEWMERINRLGIAYFRPLVTALFCQVMKGKVNHDKSVSLLKALERFIFIEFRLQTTRSNYGSSEFNKAARELHKGLKNVDGIIGMLQERIERSFETDETGQKYFKTLNMQVMVDKLFEQKDDERVGYYRWSAIRYFLYEYNAYLVKEKYHGQGELKWDSFKQSEKDKISIEHIFPHKAEGYWAEQFKNVDKDKWPIYEGSLGNLLLLSQKINAELQNDDFKTKKEGRESADESKKRTGYSKGSAAELEVNNEKDWTPETIEKTGMTMLKFMEDDQWGWGIKFKSEEEKKNLLLPGIY